MLLKVFAVYDNAAQFYDRPFYEVSKGSAIRAFTDAVNDSNTAISKHPQDFVLFELGEYDTSSASFTLSPAPASLGVAVEYLQKKSSPKIEEVLK